MVHYTEYDSPVGKLLLTGNGTALTGVWMNREAAEGMEPIEDAVLQGAKKWLDGYFSGRPGEIDFSMEPQGTHFQKQVWQILLSIPYGRTRTYGDIAREMALQMHREKMSAQAVGGAVGKNPISILIPCHRCLGAGGRITGYAGGLEKKQWLLDHEGIRWI